jgi:hypothetical protein
MAPCSPSMAVGPLLEMQLYIAGLKTSWKDLTMPRGTDLRSRMPQNASEACWRAGDSFSDGSHTTQPLEICCSERRQGEGEPAGKVSSSIAADAIVLENAEMRLAISSIRKLRRPHQSNCPAISSR